MSFNKGSVLITGASGMLGKDITALFASMANYKVFALHRNTGKKLPWNNVITINADITDAANFASTVKEIKPEITIHCAAVVNVDACETDTAYADKLHSEAVKVIAEAAPDTRLIYISTDSVFDGTRGNYRENDIANPVNYYAKSKFDGDVNTLKLFETGLVVRTNIYGFHLYKQPSLAEWALDNLSQGQKISGFNDVYFNPVYTKQLAEVVLKLATTKYNGIINVASDKFISKYLFLVELARAFGYNTDLIESKSVNSASFKAKRPNNTTLNTELLNTLTGSVPGLTEGINRFCLDYNTYTSKRLTNEEH
jgi:dTDP-4-dehydrorhamnose reductase